MNVSDTPEYKAGYEWAEPTSDVFREIYVESEKKYLPGWNQIYVEGEKRYRPKKHSYENLVRWEAFVAGAGQRLAEAGVPEAKEAVERFARGWEETLALYKQGADPNPPPPPGTGRTVHYLYVVNPGPLITIRIPYPMPRWNDLLKALTPVMRSHGLMKKDISLIEAHLPAPDGPFNEEELRFAERLDAAYQGDPKIIPTFWLYDWKKGRFVLVREPSRK